MKRSIPGGCRGPAPVASPRWEHDRPRSVAHGREVVVGQQTGQLVEPQLLVARAQHNDFVFFTEDPGEPRQALYNLPELHYPTLRNAVGILAFGHSQPARAGLFGGPMKKSPCNGG